MRLACGPVKTLTETKGQRSHRPLAASLRGFASHLHAADRTGPELGLKQRQD